MEYKPLSTEEERIATAIVDSAYAVHKALGPGLLEHVYEVCFCHEIGKRGLRWQRQCPVSIVYDNITFEEGLRLDVIVEDLVICEIKAVETLHRVVTAQLLSYLRLTGKRLGFILNFHVPLIKDGIQRLVC